MQCPNCGATIKNESRFCEFCGSQITVEMQKEREQLNKVGCPNCGSSNVTFNREKQGEVKGKNGTTVVRTTVGLCKDCGYTWNTTGNTQSPKKKMTWLWVLGWIYIFPLPLTILMLRKKDMKPVLKYGIIVIAWMVYLAIGAFGKPINTSSTPENDTEAIVSENNSDATTNNEEKQITHTVDAQLTFKYADSEIISKFNSDFQDMYTVCLKTS